MSDELPPLWALDAAAKAAGFRDWQNANQLWNNLTVSEMRASIIAHARTLQRLAKYERPPIDPAELKRRQDAREAVALANDAYSPVWAAGARQGLQDDHIEILAAYIALCREHKVTPIPVEEWGK